MKHYPLFYETWKTNEIDSKIEFNLQGRRATSQKVVSHKIKNKAKKRVTSEQC